MLLAATKQNKKNRFSERLNQILDALEYPPLHLGRIERLKDVFQVSQTAARKWITGLSLPHYERRKQIALQLGVCFEWLEQGLGPMFLHHEMVATYAYPLFTKQDLKKGMPILEAPVHQVECVAAQRYVQGFMVVQTFKEMASRFPIGSFLLVDPASPLEDQAFCLVQLASDHSIVFRQLKITKQACFLCAIEGEVPPLLLDPADLVFGRVIQVIVHL